jgi:chromosome segregation ATPase
MPPNGKTKSGEIRVAHDSGEDTDVMLSRYIAQSDRMTQALESCNSNICRMEERLGTVEDRIGELSSQVQGNLQALMEHKLEKAQAETATAVTLAKIAAVCEDHGRRFTEIEKKETEKRSAWAGLLPSVVCALIVGGLSAFVTMVVAGNKPAPSTPTSTAPAKP